MVKFISSVLIFLAAVSNAGPLIVGKGAGQSEYALVFSRLHLTELFSVCRGSRCTLTEAEKADLAELIRRAASVPEAVFKTSTEMGSKIYEIRPKSNQVWFNQDLLWQDNQMSVAYDEAFAAGVWVEALASLPPAMEPVRVSHVRSQIQSALRGRILRSHTVWGQNDVFGAVIWKHDRGVNDRIFVHDSNFDGYELSRLLRTLTYCSNDNIPPANIRFFTPRWTSTENSGEGFLTFRVELMLSWECGMEGQRTRAKLFMRARADEKTGNYVYQEDSFRVYSEGQ